MINISLERGYYEETDGKKLWSKHSEGEHLLIMTDDGRKEVVSAYNPKAISDMVLKLSTEKSLSLGELLVRASQKGIEYYYGLIEKNKEEELASWVNDKEFEEMKIGVLADYQDYRKFFDLLLIHNKHIEACEFWGTLDTRPREYIWMWLKEEHLLEI